MTIPRFSSVEEADAWMARYKRDQRKAEIVKEIVSLPGPVYLADNSYRVLYSTVPLSSGKFGCVVFDRVWTEPNVRAVYVREFVRRKDAKAKALQLYWKYSPKRKSS